MFNLLNRIQSILQDSARPPRSTHRGRSPRRSLLESLEQRSLLTTIVNTSFETLPGNVSVVPNATHYPQFGEIRLTENTPGQQGSLLVSYGSRAVAFSASARVYLGNDAGGGDGMSFGYGSLSGSAFGEAGTSSGVWISIDTHEGDQYSGRVYIIYNGTVVDTSGYFNQNAHSSNGIAGRGYYTMTWSVTESGLFQYNHPAIGTRSAQLSGWGSAVQSNWRFGIGARTGAAYDEHAISDLSITDNTSTPTNLSLSASTVNENDSGATVGTLSTTDAGGSTSFTYSLVSGTGSTDNSSFQIVGNQLRTATGLNFEAGSSRSVRIRTTDQAGLSFERAFSISVTNLNEAPTDISLSGTTVSENQPAGTTVGSFSSSDPDSGNTFTYSLVAGTGSTDNASFQIVGNSLQTSASLNFEAGSTRSVRVRTSDQNGLTYDEAFTITVSNVNEAPTDITLSNTSVAENQPIGTAVGTLSTVDPDAGGSFSYQLISGTGDTDNAQFEIQTATLKTKTTFDYSQKNKHSIRLRVTDNSGLTAEKAFIIDISPVVTGPPQLLQIISPPVLTSGNTNQDFGFSVALTKNKYVIGAPFATVSSAVGAGRAFVFDADDTTIARNNIANPAPVSIDRFAISTATAGNIIVLGAPYDQVGSTAAGRVLLYNAETGSLAATINSPVILNNMRFGYDVAASETLVAISAPLIANGKSDGSKGLVYLHDHSGTLLRTLSDPNSFSGSLFGQSIDLDSTHIAVSDNGAQVAVFASNTGTFVRTISPPITNFGGYAVAVSGDYVAIGAPQAIGSSGFSSGKVFVYRISTGALLHTLEPQSQGAGFSFGSSVDIDGKYLAIGAPGTKINGVSVGAGYVYDLNTGTLFGSLTSPTLAASGAFGSDVSIAGTRILVGANGEQRAYGFTMRSPYVVTLSDQVVPENSSPNTVVGTFAATPSAALPVTYSLVSGTGSDDNGSFQIIGSSLRALSAFNFEAKSTYTTLVEATDANGRKVRQSFLVNVSDTNESPTLVKLSDGSIDEMLPAGSLVGFLSTADVDANDSFTYSLVDSSSYDNSYFTIVGNQLRAGVSFDFERRSRYSVRVRSEDSGGLAAEGTLQITVENVNPHSGTAQQNYDLRPLIDLNDTVQSSTPGAAVELNGVIYFSATTPGHGSELWRTDGTTNGTRMVTDLSAAEVDSRPRSLTTINDKLLFISSYDYVDPNAPPGGIPERRVGLFASDGAATGTTLLQQFTDLSSDVTDFATQNVQFTEISGKLYFVISGNEHQLWSSDGTVVGTTLIKTMPLRLPPGPTTVVSTAKVGNLFLFNLDVDQSGGHSLWRSDGTTAGTYLLRNVDTAAFGFYQPDPSLVSDGSKAYFVSYSSDTGNELWVTNGTVGGTTLVKDINSGSTDSGVRSMVQYNGRLYFAADNGFSGFELWTSNGTSVGTEMVKDISPGFIGGVESEIAVWNDRLYFAGQDSLTGIEIWSSDGTAAGTSLVRDVDSGSNGLYPAKFINLGSTLLVATSPYGAFPNQIWKTDGTSAGTVLVSNTGGENFLVTGSKAFFRSSSGDGTELWVTNGTTAGTFQLRDLNPGTASGLDDILGVGLGGVVFRGTSSLIGTELGFSNGTTSGTKLIDVARGTPGSEIKEVLRVGGLNYIATATKLIRTDGTQTGTIVLKDFEQFNGPRELIAMGSTVYFSAEGSSSQGRELWRTDGTPAGTVLHKDIRSGAADSVPSRLTAFDGSVFFVSDNGTHGAELWQSNVGDSRATLFREFVTGPAGGDIRMLRVHGEYLYVIAAGYLHRVDENGNVVTLGRTNGSSIMPWENVVFFSGYTAEHGDELWRTDGTVVGTYLVSDLLPGPASSYPGGGIVLEGAADESVTIEAKLIFRASIGNLGTTLNSQLWSTDGTTSGTRQLTSFAPRVDEFGNAASFTPIGLTRLGGKVIFEAYDAVHGRELWESNGTAAGTKLVKDLTPGTGPDPLNFSITESWIDQRIESWVTFRDQVFFRKGDLLTGKELWTSDGTSAGSYQAIDIVPESGSGHPTNMFVDGDRLYLTADTLDFGLSSIYPGGGELFYVNESPYAPSITRTIAQGASTAIELVAADRDGDALTYEVVASPSNGTAAIVDGVLTYTPTPGFAGNVQFSYRAFDGSLYSNTATLSITVRNNPNTVSFASASTTVSEQDRILYVDLSLAAPADSLLVIPYTIEGTDAVASGNNREQVAVFPEGASTARIAVRIKDDFDYETSPQVIEITLQGNQDVVVGAVSQHLVNIVDNDSRPVLRFTTPWQTVRESNETFAVNVGLSAASDGVVRVAVNVSSLDSATRNGDFLAPGLIELEFSPGERVKSIPLRLVNDGLAENRELIRLQIDSIENAVLGSAISDHRHLTWIEDDDTSIVNLSPAVQLGLEEETMTIVATRTGGNLSQAISVPFTIFGNGATQNVDYTLSASSFNFAAGQATASITAQLLDDGTSESFEAFTILLQDNTSFNPGDVHSAYVGIYDNDSPTVSLTFGSTNIPGVSNPSRIRESNPSSTTAPNTVQVIARLSNPSTTTISIPVVVNTGLHSGFASSGTDFHLATSDFVFSPGQTEIIRTLSIYDDSNEESDETIRIALEPRPDQFYLRSGGIVDNGTLSKTLTIVDDDERVSVSAPRMVREDAGQVEFIVSLSKPASRFVRVPFGIFGTAGPNDWQVTAPYSGSFGEVFFSAGELSKAIVINITNDSILEAPEVITMHVGQTPGGAYQSSVPVTINDDEGPPTVSFRQDGFGLSSPSDNPFSLAIELSYASPSSVTLDVKIAGSAIASGNVVIAAGAGQYMIQTNSTPPASSSEPRIYEGKLWIPAGATVGEIVFLPDPGMVGNRELEISIDGGTNILIPDERPTISRNIYDAKKPPRPTIPTPTSSDVETSTGSLAGLDKAMSNPAGTRATNYNAKAFSNANAANVNPGPLQISTHQGLLAGAVLFFDANFNGIRDFLDLNENGRQDPGEPDEPSAESADDGSTALDFLDLLDRDGSGVIEPHEGHLVVYGGIDTSTQLPWSVPLSAPVGSYVVTPLSTIVDHLIRQTTLTPAAALTQVKTALGIADYDATGSSAIYDILANDSVAASAYQQQILISSLAIEMAHLADGASTQGLPTSADSAYGLIARALHTASGPVDLANVQLIASMLASLGKTLPTPFSQDVIDGAATVLSRGARRIQELSPQTFSSPKLFLERLTQVKKLMHGELAQALREVGAGTRTITDVTSTYSEANFDGLVAAQQIGVLIPTTIGVAHTSIVEGNTGESMMEFTVLIVGDHQQEVRVDYATDEGTATPGLDYTSVSGTLVWAAGDTTPRIIQVPIKGDSFFEQDEYLNLRLSNELNSVIRVPRAVGYMLNDDALSFSSTTTTGTNRISVAASRERVDVAENGRTVQSGDLYNPLSAHFSGSNNVPNEFVLSFTNAESRSDSVTFVGGALADSSSIRGGQFASIRHRVLTVNGTSTVMTSENGENIVTSSSEVEYHRALVSQLDVFTLELPETVTDIIIEDADPDLPGTMRIRSSSSQFAPIEITNPTLRLEIVAANSSATLTTLSTDSAFAGSIKFNRTPTDVGLSNASVEENRPGGTAVGALSTTDPDNGNSFTYSLALGAGSEDNARFIIDGNTLKTAAVFDYETKSTYSVRVRSTDQGGLSVENVLTISVTDVNENSVPTDISLSNSNVVENMPSGTAVGTLSTTDPDSGNTFTYSLVIGTGDTDNTRFAIDGGTLKTTESFDYEAKSSYSIRVRSTDQGGLSFEKVFTISVTDVQEDVTAPQSLIAALPVASNSLTFSLSASATDPGGVATSGVSEIDFYYSTGGSFIKFATSPASNPTANFTGSPNTTYWFRSIARDNAGNVESKTSADTYTRIGDVLPPTTHVTSATHNSGGLFTINMTGSKASGTPMTAFDVYVVIDSNAPVLVGTAGAGVATAGVYSASLLYQGLADSNSHSYRFYSVGKDSAGNVEAASVSGDVSVTVSFSAGGLTLGAIDVQNGSGQRSYVRHLDLLFSSSTGLSSLANTGRVRVERFGIDATSVNPGTGTLISGFTVNQAGNRLKLDFGATGLGGLRQAGNGFYRVLVDVDGNGNFTDAGDGAMEFHRLFGDADGNGIVDIADTNLVTSQIGRTGTNLDGDLDGNGAVNSTDRLFTTQQRGKKLLDPLLGWLDD